MTTKAFVIPGIVPALTRWWVGLYCAGTSQAVRERRHTEIESDLWEHYADRTQEGASPAAINTEMVSRLLRGAPSDIAWRFQVEGFQMNIHFPIERVIGVLLLFLLVPFFAISAISGYDTRQEGWPDAFQGYVNNSSGSREVAAALHVLVGALVLIGVSQLLAYGLRRSPALIAAAAALLAASGFTMLVNGALFYGMSTLADEFAANGDTGIVATARSFARAIEFLGIMNLGLVAGGVCFLSVAVYRMEAVPRWTLVLPLGGGLGIIGAFATTPVSDSWSWGFLLIGWISISLWLIICGLWLLLGGNRSPQARAPEPNPA